MKRKSLAFKLIIGGMLAVILPVGFTGVFSVTRSSEALSDLSNVQAITLSRVLADMTEVVLEEELKLAMELAAGNATIAAAEKVDAAGIGSATPEIGNLMVKLRHAMARIGKDYEAFVVANRGGVVFAGFGEGEMIGISLADREYFQKVIQDRKARSGTMIPSRVTGKPVVPFAAPVFSDSDELVGVFVSVLKAEFLVRKITGIQLGATGYPYLLNEKGLVIAHPREELVFKTDVNTLEGMEIFAERISRRETGIETYVYQGTPKIAAFTFMPLTDWTLVVTQDIEEFLAPSGQIRNAVWITGGLFLLITILSVLFFARRISRPIMHSMEAIGETSEQVAAASGEVAATAQSLAEGAGEQAASLEETTSSLEEMSSMTRQNAEHARQMKLSRDEAFQSLQSADQFMKRTGEAMSSIQARGNEVSVIVKSIDEIAFRTNLLALNAAVEAARAGQAGAGFAVVADEVRNLAVRAAEAAKNTQKLIETITSEIRQGSELIDKTQTEFGITLTHNRKVGELIDEIVVSAREQARGIEQISTAVAEMDKVIQNTAANAEESAGAAEEMNAQAEQMKEVVRNLQRVVGGDIGHSNGGRNGSPNFVEQIPTVRVRGRDSITKREKAHYGKTVHPDQVIPFDESDFKDF